MPLDITETWTDNSARSVGQGASGNLWDWQASPAI
jgi:hypothetical protein